MNIIIGVRSLYTLRDSIDTVGEEKTMDFIDDLILEHIKEIGEGRVFVVCMDDIIPGLRHASIAGRSRIGSIQRGETGSVRNLSSVSCALTPI